MISVLQKVGRLTEIRMRTPVVLDEVTVMQRDVASLGAKTATKLVVCADLSRASVFPEPLADRLGRFFRSEHQRLDRVAFVVGEGATFFMQIERLLRDSAPSSKDLAREAAAQRTSVAGDPPPPKRVNGASDPTLGKRPITRRVFRSATEAMAWLEDALSTDERARLKQFLADPSS
ncbi:MAG: hypothetical protein R3B70_10205 [Polyangiaceae bacterium]